MSEKSKAENQRDEEVPSEVRKIVEWVAKTSDYSEEWYTTLENKITKALTAQRQSWEREKAELKAEYDRKLLALSEQTVNRIYLYEGSDLEAETLNRLEKEKAGLEERVKYLEKFLPTAADFEDQEAKLTRLKSRNEELEKQCRGWLELQTKQIEENNRLNAENAELQKESYECTCTKELHGSLCRYCYIQTALSVCKENTEQKETISRLTSALGAAMEIIRKILKQCYLVPVDHACIECIPAGSSVVEGFLCGVHEGVKALSDPTGQLAFEKWKKLRKVLFMANKMRRSQWAEGTYQDEPAYLVPVSDFSDLKNTAHALEALDAKGAVHDV